ncbi:ABC transporter permease [Kutzneria buriramensis]|uniref:ABC-2 type transport system permease protein n=1 Tax=Kutzneria buriramensis TaxID=1045776 RepID=A0A3E0GV21_9PSEU|nr:ABC transporter permease [Kutzneria buriramensis]REH29458.1 ABC-2 type transport system permease protein [Kutzneria buriramensis]
MTTSRVIGLVAGREFNTRVRSKSFLVSTVVILAVLAAYALLFTFIAKETTVKVGLTGQATAMSAPLSAAADKLGKKVQISTVDNQDDGVAQVRAGKLDVLVQGPLGAPTAVVKSTLDPELQVALEGLVRAQAIQGVLAQAGLPPTALNAAQSATVKVSELEPPDPEQGQRIALSLITGIVLVFSIMAFGTAVAQGVVEEKSSRVVEILLSTIRPWQLLLGKVLGIGVVGLIQVVIIAVVGLTVANSTGVFSLPTVALGTILGALGWYVLGFFLYAALLAAAGSLVSRQEELQSAITPVSLLPTIAFVVGVNLLIPNPTNTISTVLSMIPLFTPTLMPSRIALGVAPVWQIALSVALMVAAIALVTWLAGRIYRNAVLQTGARVRLLDALRS